jgi:nicotinamidase-related amidase
MRDEILDNIVETLPDVALRRADVQKENSALLIIDMQNYFWGITEGIVPNLKRLIEACRRAGLPVIYTQHGYNNPGEESGMLGEWWDDPIIVGTKNWEFIPEIAPMAGEKIISKMRYSAFYDTDLSSHLESHLIKNVIIGGVMTNLCCETTARDAFVRDYRVFFLTDGNATVSEEYHAATLTNLAYGFAYLKKCSEIVDELNSLPESLE